MKLKTLMMIAAGAAVLSTTAVQAQRESNWSMKDRFAYTTEGELFLANEFSLDAFGHYTTTGRSNFEDIFTHNVRGGRFGGGIGLNYFITKFIGVSTDVEMGDNGRQFIDSAAANLVLRLPLDAAHLAPYVFGGGGGQFDPTSQWMADVGVGIEFRINHWTGIFADGRYVWPEKTGDYGLFRAGMRFAF
ncbi:MAG: hypothetical protein JWM68_5094 [Verrucomicrobiales bacterium]|nr:hypothetical protein [Verrucomicrobiales bacterium]